MGSVYFAENAWRFKYKDAAGAWQTVTTKADTKAQAKVLMREKELEAERQRLGLAPLSLNPNGWTLGDLMQWWLDKYSRHQESHGRNLNAVRNHILASPLAAKRLEHVRPGDIERLLQAKHGDLAPQTINHIRQYLVRAFNKARRAGEWLGGNPAQDVEARKVPEPVIEILRPEEVLPFFLQLDLDQRVVFAAAISSGLRKGELCGLLKKDLDLPRRLLAARHSYARPFPKSKKQRVVRVPEEFVAFYEYAAGAYPGPWLFPHADGTMRDETWQPEDVLRRALKRAGIVTGYSHVCRRKGCLYSEDRRDDEVRPCPRCGYKLWPKGHVRHIRFHDLRHYAGCGVMPGTQRDSVIPEGIPLQGACWIRHNPDVLLQPTRVGRQGGDIMEQLFVGAETAWGLHTGPLGDQVASFVEVLRSCDYARASIHAKLLVLSQLSRWLARRELGLRDVDHARIREFLRWHRRRHRAHRGVKVTTIQLLRHLRTTGALPPEPAAVTRGASAEVEERYATYLREERGLAHATLVNYIPLVHRFLVDRFRQGARGAGATAGR